MIAIKGMEMQTDCKKCPLMGTNGIDKFSPMMCIAIWATKREIKHCVEGKILDDCPLVEIVTCKDCKHYKHHGVNGYCSKRVNTDSHTDVYREPDYFCALGEKREETETEVEEGYGDGFPKDNEFWNSRITGNPDFCNG